MRLREACCNFAYQYFLTFLYHTNIYLTQGGKRYFHFKDTHRENTPSNKTKALTEIMNMCFREICTLDQIFI